MSLVDYVIAMIPHWKKRTSTKNDPKFKDKKQEQEYSKAWDNYLSQKRDALNM